MGLRERKGYPNGEIGGDYQGERTGLPRRKKGSIKFTATGETSFTYRCTSVQPQMKGCAAKAENSNMIVNERGSHLFSTQDRMLTFAEAIETTTSRMVAQSTE